MQGHITKLDGFKSRIVSYEADADFPTLAANQNQEWPVLLNFSRFPGLSGQNLAGSGALVFEGELLHIA